MTEPPEQPAPERIAVHWSPEARAHRQEFFRDRLRGPLAGVVPVIGDKDFLRAVLLECGPVIVREPIHPVARRHMPIPRAPESQRIDQRWTHRS